MKRKNVVGCRVSLGGGGVVGDCGRRVTQSKTGRGAWRVGGVVVAAALSATAGVVRGDDIWFGGNPSTTTWTNSTFYKSYARTEVHPFFPNATDTVYFAAQGAVNLSSQNVYFGVGSGGIGGLKGAVVDSRNTQDFTLNCGSNLANFGLAGLIINSPTALTINTSSAIYNNGPWNVANALAVVTVNGPIDNGSVGPSLRKSGPGLLTLNGNMTGGGTPVIRPIDLLQGVLQLGNVNALASPVATVLFGGFIDNSIKFGGGTLRFTAGNTVDYSARIAYSVASIDLDTNGQNVTFASPMASSNGAGLRKLGAGTLSLSGANAYGGATTIAEGGLEVLPGGTIPVGSAVAVQSGATLRLTRSDTWGNSNATASSPITVRAGGVLATNNSFNTLVNLSIEGSSTVALGGGFSAQFPALGLKGTVSVFGYTGLGAQIIATTGGFNAINVGPTDAPGSVTFDVADVSASAGLAVDLTVAVPLQNPQNSTGTGALASGVIKAGVGVMSLSAVNTYTGPTQILGGTVILAPGGQISPASAISLGTGTLLRLTRSDAWGVHTTTTSSPVTVGPGATLASAGTFNTLVGPTFTGGTLLLNGGALAAFPAFAFKGTVTVSGSQPTQFVGGSGSFNAINIGPSDAPGALTFAVADVTASAAADLTVGVPLQNQQIATGTGALASGLTKTGAGTLTLTAANTYTGPTRLAGGVLNLGHANAIATGSAVTFAGGTLQYSAANQADVSARIVNSAGAINIDTGGQTVTYASAIGNTNSGGLTKLGAGTLILTAENTFGGQTTVSAGTLRLDSASVGGTISSNAPITVAGGATLLGGTTDALGFLNNLSNNAITLNSGGTLSVVTGSRLSVDRNVTLVGGRITSEGAGDAAGAFLFRSTQGNGFTVTSAPDATPALINAQGIALQGTLPFNVSRGPGTYDLLVDSNLTNLSGFTGGVSKSGNGIMILAGTNSYTAGTTVSAGTLQIGNGGNAGSVAGNITNNAALVFDRSNALAHTGLITGTGSITKQGAGTVSFTAGKTAPFTASSLSITGGAIDLTDNDLVLRSMTLPAVASLVAGGRLRSSLATAVSYTTLATFANTVGGGVAYYATLGGTTLTAGDVLVKYTYWGDTDLNGRVDGADLARAIEGLTTGRTGWANGDTNYDGTVNATDISRLLAAMANQGAPLGSAPTAGAVPEPAGLVVAAVPALLLTRRRRGRAAGAVTSVVG